MDDLAAAATVVEWYAARVLYRVSACAERLRAGSKPGNEYELFLVSRRELALIVSKTNALAGHYQERLTSPSPSPFPQHTLIPLAIALNDETPSVINDPFNIKELNRGLTSMRGTATGHDDIHNEHLNHMPDYYKTWLLQLYNKSLQSGMLPTVWQPAIIIPLPNPNKPLTSVDSYRPISLLSCVQNLMERLIVSRLTFFLEQKGVFRKTQGGYRRRLSAIDQVTKLEAAIRSTLVNKSIMLCLFVDFSSAFDTVWPMGVLYKLSRCGVRGTMLRWLLAYLKDRPFKLFIEGTYSSERIARSGVPQGAVLSPLLFNIMMYDTPVEERICSCEYADDLAFYTQHPNFRIATETLQQQLTALHNSSKQWGLKINFNKTKCMLFTNKRINPLPITVGGQQLEFTKQFKYLGVMKTLLSSAGIIKWNTSSNPVHHFSSCYNLYHIGIGVLTGNY
ncbi:Reverse transcriptase domain [Trinorchestia longiramus]|nr:Reverse transcriptase domain [Trinorchestia longiramus]